MTAKPFLNAGNSISISNDSTAVAIVANGKGGNDNRTGHARVPIQDTSGGVSGLRSRLPLKIIPAVID